MRGFDYEFSLLSLPHKLFLPKHPISLMTSYLQQLNVFLQLLLEIPESSSRPEQLSFLEVPGVLDLCSLFTHSLFSNSVSFFSFFLFLFLLTVLRHCYLAIYCKSGKEEIFFMFPVGLCINNRQPGGSCPWVVGAQMATIRPSLDSHRPACSLTSLPLGAWALSRVLLWLLGNTEAEKHLCGGTGPLFAFSEPVSAALWRSFWWRETWGLVVLSSWSAVCHQPDVEVVPWHFRAVYDSEVAQLCPTLCDPMDCSPPGSSVHGIFQARVPEWVAIFFSRGSSRPRDRTQASWIAGRCFTLWATRDAHYPWEAVKSELLMSFQLKLHSCTRMCRAFSPRIILQLWISFYFVHTSF